MYTLNLLGVIASISIIYANNVNLNDALVLKINNERTYTLLKKTGVIEHIEANLPELEKTYPDLSIDKTIDDDICLTYNTIVSTLFMFTCEVAESAGLGKTVATRFVKAKLFKSPSIIPFSEEITAVENENKSIECIANGIPDVRVAWVSTTTNGTKFNQTAMDFSTNDNSSVAGVRLNLYNISAADHGHVFKCVANTSQPIGINTTFRQFSLKVQTKPKIFGLSTIHTDFNVTEEIKFLVTGYPKPKFECGKLLHSEQPVNMSNMPFGGITMYVIKFFGMNSDDMGEYVCTAVNDVGQTTHKFTLTVEPGLPVVLRTPSELNKWANYHLLTWKTDSRVKLTNITVLLKEISGNKSTVKGNVYPRSPREHHLAFLFDKQNNQNHLISMDTNPEFESIYKSKEHNVTNPVWRKLILQHLLNLSADTLYEVGVEVCNKYACVQSLPSNGNNSSPDSRITMTSIHRFDPNGLVDMSEFRTAKFDGSNNIDEDLLTMSPLEMIERRYPDALRSFGLTGVNGGADRMVKLFASQLILMSLPFFLVHFLLL